MTTGTHLSGTRSGRVPAILVLACTAVLALGAGAHAADRTGKEVVNAVCAGCHSTGANKAPKIGDEKAWAPLAARGLSSLTRSALDGIRNMPAHGGSPGLSDIEIERAITYMVNVAGGKWVEPVSGVTPAVQRKGKEIVEATCAKCHAEGKNGAPRIGNLNDWIPRLKFGIDLAVRSAIHGHGPMPARGGVADLTDPEIRAAVNYMVNPSVASELGQPPVEVTVAPSNRKIVDGIEVYLGIVPAETLRNRPKTSPESKMHGGVPSGSDYYHLNISLFDSKTRQPVTDAQVEARVSEPVMGGESKKLEPVTIAQVQSYGNYFRMTSRNPYAITVTIRRPGMPKPVEAKFDFRRY